MWISESRGEAETEDNVTRQRRLAERRDVIVRQDVLVEERVTTLQHFGDSDGLKFGVGGRHDTRVDLNCGRLEIPHRLENKVSWHARVLTVCMYTARTVCILQGRACSSDRPVGSQPRSDLRVAFSSQSRYKPAGKPPSFTHTVPTRGCRYLIVYNIWQGEFFVSPRSPA